MSTRPLISAAFVKLMLASLDQSGRDRERVLRRAGLTWDAVQVKDFRITQLQYSRLLSGLTHVTQDEFWGLCEHRIPLGTFKMLCHLLVDCRTLGDALRIGTRLYRLVIPDFTLRVHATGNIAEVRLTDRIADPRRRPAVHGATMFLLYHMMCWLVDRRLPLHSVDLAYVPQPHSLEPASTYHRAKVTFCCERTALRVEQRWLSLPIVPDHQRADRFLSRVPHDLLLRYREETSVADSVRAMLRRSLDHPPSLEEVAERLHMTTLTLSRRLRAEGQNGFQDMRDRVRHEAAVDLLQNPHLSLEHIAEHLGFAEHSTFHRAFRRWTGMSPGSFRSSLDSCRE